MKDDEFERLYAAEAQGLFAFLAYRTGDRVLAEDLLADAFERALRSRVKYDRKRGSEKTWLYAIARNAAQPWQSQWYATPDFGMLKHGTGLLLSLGGKVTVTSVRLDLAQYRSTNLQIRVGNGTAPQDLKQVVAKASNVGGVVKLTESAAGKTTGAFDGTCAAGGPGSGPAAGWGAGSSAGGAAPSAGPAAPSGTLSGAAAGLSLRPWFSCLSCTGWLAPSPACVMGPVPSSGGTESAAWPVPE